MASRLWGDWKKLKMIAVQFKNFFRRDKNIQQDLLDIGEYLLETLKENVRNSAFDLAPLSIDYAERKPEGLPILVLTEEWLDALKTEKVDVSDKSFTIFIGAGDEKLRNGLTVETLTTYIEEGTPSGSQPPRPIFLLTWENIKPEIQQKVINVVGKEVFDFGFKF